MATDSEIELIEYSDCHAGVFLDLNVEWLEKYFYVEPIDLETLGDPQTHILDSGGAIIFARKGAEIVGTVALKHHGDGRYELTKMAVTERSQGAGTGRRLLAAAVDRFAELGGSELYLESHSSLLAALSLYEAAGFVHSVLSEPSRYAQVDVYMEYRPKR
jgi:ribosomal protein S18 acetylase RimI-like enzyme